ncbi:MAG: DUF4304 domain-containing protein [Spirochaetes bacterium]|nr:DUF4304 domain-containing protein [Bacteroidales bacterium]MBN2772085.1 DUF4304 domain-containing protein [Spirochaetota bacterium]
MNIIVRKDINTFLKKTIIPQFREKGFTGSFPHLRRIIETSIDLITFQFDRYGGGFVIELAKAKNEVFKTHWGEEIPQSKLTAHDLNERTRIHTKGILQDSATENWFRYDKGSLFSNPLKQIQNDIEKNMSVIEKFFNPRM